jgi:hypothetical protein
VLSKSSPLAFQNHEAVHYPDLGFSVFLILSNAVAVYLLIICLSHTHVMKSLSLVHIPCTFFVTIMPVFIEMSVVSQTSIKVVYSGCGHY